MQTEYSILVPGRGRPYVAGDMLDHTGPLVWTVPDMLPAEACAALVAKIEALGPEAAPITTPRGFVMRPDIRNNKRVIFDDVALAARLFDGVGAALPQRLCGMRPSGANERFRCYRYEPGQRFAPHFDGAFVRDGTGERSLLTFMVYLNEEFDGGETAFHEFDVRVRPRTGTALLFQHRLLHESCVVTSGIKYALRSDVMYCRV
jgi:predicted 2-oxoglutarate/Fe(II)-dependent dioxygenase YbiX